MSGIAPLKKIIRLVGRILMYFNTGHIVLTSVLIFFLASYEVFAGQDFIIASPHHKYVSKEFDAFKNDGATTAAPNIETVITEIFPNMKRENQVAIMRELISARSAIVVDVNSQETLYSHAPDMEGQPASTIKILTGLIALNALEKTEVVEVSRKAAGMPRSKVNLEEGATYPALDLIYAALLNSANDASVALAEKIAGSERLFAILMTYRAREMGAHNTVCKTATGLTAEGQKTTVRDLALLFSKAMQNEEFAEIMASSRIITNDGAEYYSHNRALWQVHGAEGGKTGFTNAAGQTYVGKFCRGDDELIVAIMGSEKMWDDVQCLVTYGFTKKQKIDSEVTALQLISSPADVGQPALLSH